MATKKTAGAPKQATARAKKTEPAAKKRAAKSGAAKSEIAEPTARMWPVMAAPAVPAAGEESAAKSEANYRGIPLLMKMREEADRRNFNLAETANFLGLSKPYLAALYAFQRPVDRLGEEYMDKIAKFLKIPKAQVYCLAEILQPEDFVHDFKLEDQLAEAFRAMRNDPTWMSYAPSEDEAADLPERIKIGYAYLYQTVAHQRFVEGIVPVKFKKK